MAVKHRLLLNMSNKEYAKRFMNTKDTYIIKAKVDLMDSFSEVQWWKFDETYTKGAEQIAYYQTQLPNNLLISPTRLIKAINSTIPLEDLVELTEGKDLDIDTLLKSFEQLAYYMKENYSENKLTAEDLLQLPGTGEKAEDMARQTNLDLTIDSDESAHIYESSESFNNKEETENFYNYENELWIVTTENAELDQKEFDKKIDEFDEEFQL